MTVNGRALTIFNDSGMRKILVPIQNALRLSGNPVNINSSNIKIHIDHASNFINEQIKKEVKGILVSVKFDTTSTTCNKRGFLGINLQYTVNGELKVRTIGVTRTYESNTAEYLVSIINPILAKFDITIQQLYTVTTDNGSNMLASIKRMNKNAAPDMPINEELESEEENDESDNEIDETRNLVLLRQVMDIYKSNEPNTNQIFGINCGAHTFQLAVNEAISSNAEASKIIGDSRQIVKKQRNKNVLLKKENCRCRLSIMGSAGAQLSEW